MALRRLQWRLHTLGPDLASWPERERRAALDLLRRSMPAQQMLADAMERDSAPLPDTAVQCRMQVRLRAALGPVSRTMAGLRWGAMAACVAAGLLAGLAWDSDAMDWFTADVETGFQVASLP